VNDLPLLAGQTVTGGSYECERCGERVEIEEGTVTNLPLCPGCQNDTWKRA
jgi:formylmethanofuran dehydrogenase subunit E